MKTAKPSSADYSVGYRRPPKRSQFKPGRSGNPKGRPKPRDNLVAMLQRILTEKISLREGNQIRRVSKAEALVRSMILGAMKGDSKAISTLFKITFENAQPEDEAPIQVIIRRFSPDANQRGRQADQK